MKLDYHRYPVLYVDDEQENLIAFRYALEDDFALLTAQSGAQALELLAAHDVAVLLTDQRMPGMTGVELCTAAQRVRPEAIRMIVTAYTDMHAAIDAINKGHVSRYLVKPWRNDEIADVLRTAIELFELQRATQDMELRLLRGSQAQLAVASTGSVLHEVKNTLGALLLSVEHTEGLLARIGARLHGSSSKRDSTLHALVAEATATHADTRHSLDVLRGITAQASRRKRSDPANQCDAARVVDATVRIVRRQIERFARVEVILEDTPPANIDATALGQIVLNLVLNASQAIEGAELTGASITVSVSLEGAEIVIAVVDTGPGIAGELIERVFEPHFTTRSTGNGLGLSIVRELAEQYRARIIAMSVPGVRTRFELRLPTG